MIKKKILFFIVYLCSNVIYSQISDLGRFTSSVNVNKTFNIFTCIIFKF